VSRVAGPGFGGESASPELADHERRNVVTAHLYFDNLGGVQETEGDEPAVGAVG
jgi:hypothetical protein